MWKSFFVINANYINNKNIKKMPLGETISLSGVVHTGDYILLRWEVTTISSPAGSN